MVIKPWMFVMFVVGLVSGQHRQVFYEEINKFRHDPRAYQQQHPGLIVRCTSSLDQSYIPLGVEHVLENSSYFQAETMSSHQCPTLSHETCDAYCWKFGGCQFQKRIDWFLQDVPHYSNTLEIMIQGPKNPYKIFHSFLGSEPHCNHILNPNINVMGASFVRTDSNVLVADLAYFSSS